MTSQSKVGSDYEYELSLAEIKIRHLERARDSTHDSVSRLERHTQLLRAAIAQLREEAAEAEHRRETLEAALVTARQIGAAVGILMATRKITYDDAFKTLSAESQRRNRKLRDLAADVVLTGAL